LPALLSVDSVENVPDVIDLDHRARRATVGVTGGWHQNPSWVERLIPVLARQSPGTRAILHLGAQLWEAVAPQILFHGHMHIADEIELQDGRRIYSRGRDYQQHNAEIVDLDTLAWHWSDGPPMPRPRRQSAQRRLTRPGRVTTG